MTSPDWADWQHVAIWAGAFLAFCAICGGCYGIWLGIR